MEKKPFHETVVEAIKHASTAELSLLATLLKATKIPADHDKIKEAWQKRIAGMCSEDFGVSESLDQQKKETTK